jgi:hypothetical protein
MKFLLIFFLFFAYCFTTSFAENSSWKEKNAFSQKFKNKKIVVRQSLPDNSNVSGKLPAKNRVDKAAAKFYQTLALLPENFVSKSGLKFVTFLENLTLNNLPAAGVASGDTIYLRADFSSKTVFHEFFHIFDSQKSISGWNKLNDKNFVYIGNQYQNEKISRSKRRKINKNIAGRTFDRDFVSEYAMTNEHEDRAETFAVMMVEEKNFLKRTQRSTVLKKKMEFIIDLTSKRKLMGRDFWQKKGLFEK